MDCSGREGSQDFVLQNFCMFKFEDEEVLNRNPLKKSEDSKIYLDLFDKLGESIFSQGQSLFIQNSKLRS